MLSLASLVLGMAVAADGAGAVRVSASRSGLAVMAQGAPLSAVLEEIGRHSGTRVTYEGGAPGTLLTCDFVASTPGDAFLRALEGNGLNYALYEGTADAPGILIVSAPSGAAAPNRTSVTTSHRERAEVAEVIDSPDEVAEVIDAPEGSVATPPPDGAVPPRFGGPGRSEPVAEGVDDGDRPFRPAPPAPGQGRERAREVMRGRRGGPGSPQN